MNDQNRLEKIVDDNDRSLKTLARSLALSQGRFSLILVRCNYGSLRSQILQRLRQECNREIPELILAPSSTTFKRMAKAAKFGRKSTHTASKSG